MASEDHRFLSPPDPVSRPKSPMPLGATDCHAHVFGPFDRFPLAAERSYTPDELPGRRYLSMLDQIGFARGVVVTATAYGSNNGAMLDALKLAPERLRGVAVVTPEITDRELAAMDAAGVRGARFSEVATYKGTVGFDALYRLAPRLAELGWHAQIWTSCERLNEASADLLKLGLDLVVDHMGMFDPARGRGGHAFRGLLDLLRTGHVWIKLTPYRLSDAFPRYEDIRTFHDTLVSTAAARLLWGSDWPHVRMTHSLPDVGKLVDIFTEWVGDAAQRKRILSENAAVLYGFSN